MHLLEAIHGRGIPIGLEEVVAFALFRRLLHFVAQDCGWLIFARKVMYVGLC